MSTFVVPGTACPQITFWRAAAWAALSISVGLGIPGSAHGQEQQQRASDNGLQEVVVTGSRIVRRDLTSASPLVTVNTDTLSSTGQVGIEAALNKLPQFSAG